MKNFTIDLINSFNVSKDFVRVGLAQFASTFQDEFYLDKFYTEEEMSYHIQDMLQTGGGTKIGLALDSIKTYFEASHGGRKSEGISQNLILITDGESEDDVEDEALYLRNLGIEMFAIGIGNVHTLELLQITGDPRRMFTVENFDSLETIKKKVVDTICKSKPTPPDRTGESRVSGKVFLFEASPTRTFAFLQTAASTSSWASISLEDEPPPVSRWPAVRRSCRHSSQRLPSTFLKSRACAASTRPSAPTWRTAW